MHGKRIRKCEAWTGMNKNYAMSDQTILVFALANAWNLETGVCVRNL